MGDTFLIVDGNSLVFRAFHALPLMDWQGTYTNALHGFLMMLLRAVEEEDAKYLAVCFDEHAPTFRHVEYPDYKAGRAPTPPELIQQLASVRTLLTGMGIRWYALAGWEADDLLGTLARLGEEQGASPLLLTGDRDAMQLVTNTTQLLMTKKGITETARYTPESLREAYGFGPEQVTDWKGLAGDASDNIPGIPGVGDKTAVKLLQQYGSLENILAHAGEVKGKLGEKLVTYADQARTCRHLAEIRRDAPVEFVLADAALPDWGAAAEAVKPYHMNMVLRRLNEMSGGRIDGTPAPAETDFHTEEPLVAETPDALKEFLDTVTEAERPTAVFVSETSVSVCTRSGRNACVTLGGDLLNPGCDPAEVLAVLDAALCARPACVHDGKALLHTLRKYGLPLPEAFAWDTMLGAYLLNPQEKSYTAAALSGIAAPDARQIAAMAVSQEKRVAADGMMTLMREVELPLSMVLYRMEEAGFRVDTDFIAALGKKYEAEIAQCRQSVYDACGTEFNLNSPKQLGEVLFERLMLPHGKKTKNGWSTSADVLEGLQDIAPEVIEPLLRYRQLVKLNGTYVEGLTRLTDTGGRIHSFFDQTATATGRISSSEPNLQNIPVRTAEGKEIRRAFLPKAGWVLVDADYSQIELRLMAHFSGDAALVEAFQSGQDVHARTASEIFDVPLSEVTPALRSNAKAVNFGIIYGISGFGLARNTGVGQKEAGDFIKRYFARYPGVKRFMDESVEEGEKNGYAVTLMGRRRYLP